MKLKLKIYKKEKHFTKSNYWNFVNKKEYAHDFFFVVKKFIKIILQKYFKIKIQNISNKQFDQSFVSYPNNNKIIKSQTYLICKVLNSFFSKLNLN